MAELYAIIEAAVRTQGAAIMGVVNVTPDSFFDGGRYLDPAEAAARVDAVLDAGATIADVGAESSRPGAVEVSTAEQIRRAQPALDRGVGRGAAVSIDTTDPEVAEFALRRGAKIVNDVSCLRNEEVAAIAARHDAILVVCHSRGPMSTMSGFSAWPDRDYGDVVADVRAELSRARERAVSRGMRPDRIWFDPGFGFSKNARQSFELLGRLDELASDAPIVVGPGRKSFIAAVDPAPAEDRLGGTIAACLAAVDQGARVLRVHDVREVRQALSVRKAAREPRSLTEAAHVR